MPSVSNGLHIAFHTICLKQQCGRCISRVLAEQSHLCRGCCDNLHREWDKARDNYDRALSILSQIDISEQEKHIQNRIDMLLREIAYDYKIAISNSENLTSESAPAIISLALDDESIPLKTKQKLGELLSQLPSSGEVTSDYPIVMNEKVKEKIVLFQTRYHDAFNLWLSRSTKYMPMIRRVFKEEGIPLDIGYLPLVESGFSPSAYSWAKAAGVWQFIVGTSSRYGLKTDWYIDERRDPEKATRAAARYLKDLYKMFGDWELALASYNCGENRVKRLIKENGTSNYWELPLPKETRNYIPLFNAALYIAKDRANTAFIQIIRNHRSMILSG